MLGIVLPLWWMRRFCWACQSCSHNLPPTCLRQLQWTLVDIGNIKGQRHRWTDRASGCIVGCLAAVCVIEYSRRRNKITVENAPVAYLASFGSVIWTSNNATNLRMLVRRTAVYRVISYIFDQESRTPTTVWKESDAGSSETLTQTTNIIKKRTNFSTFNANSSLLLHHNLFVSRFSHVPVLR